MVHSEQLWFVIVLLRSLFKVNESDLQELPLLMELHCASEFSTLLTIARDILKALENTGMLLNFFQLNSDLFIKLFQVNSNLFINFFQLNSDLFYFFQVNSDLFIKFFQLNSDLFYFFQLNSDVFKFFQLNSELYKVYVLALSFILLLFVLRR